MPTLLQTIDVFGDIFEFFLPFLLTFAVMFAILQKTKLLSSDSNVNGIISFAVAFIFALSGGGKFLMALLPYLSVLFVIVFMTFLIFMFFGVKPEQVLERKEIVMTLVMIVVLFVFYVIGNLYGAELAYGVGGTLEENLTNVTAKPPGYETCNFETLLGPRSMACLIGHPKVLGTIIILGLLALATFFVIYVPKKA